MYHGLYRFANAPSSNYLPKMVVSPKVSVIIPSYNHAAYLSQRIESILYQTYTDFELIILDDCSPDNSREIISRYAAAHANVQAIFNEVNSGSTFSGN